MPALPLAKKTHLFFGPYNPNKPVYCIRKDGSNDMESILLSNRRYYNGLVFTGNYSDSIEKVKQFLEYKLDNTKYNEAAIEPKIYYAKIQSETKYKLLDGSNVDPNKANAIFIYKLDSIKLSEIKYIEV
jgi:hypothetical protein